MSPSPSPEQATSQIPTTIPATHNFAQPTRDLLYLLLDCSLSAAAFAPQFKSSSVLDFLADEADPVVSAIKEDKNWDIDGLIMGYLAGPRRQFGIPRNPMLALNSSNDSTPHAQPVPASDLLRDQARVRALFADPRANLGYPCSISVGLQTAASYLKPDILTRYCFTYLILISDGQLVAGEDEDDVLKAIETIKQSGVIVLCACISDKPDCVELLRKCATSTKAAYQAGCGLAELLEVYFETEKLTEFFYKTQSQEELKRWANAIRKSLADLNGNREQQPEARGGAGPLTPPIPPISIPTPTPAPTPNPTHQPNPPAWNPTTNAVDLCPSCNRYPGLGLFCANCGCPIR